MDEDFNFYIVKEIDFCILNKFQNV